MALNPGKVFVKYLIFASCFLFVSFVIRGAEAHIAAWHKGMYCLNGTKAGVDNLNTDDAVIPLYQLNKTEWWMHHNNSCDEFPPAPGDFLELPANGEFTVELAVNRAWTTLSNNGSKAGVWPDGQDHPGLGGPTEGKANPQACISSPNIHTQNESMAAGTSFAISYTSDITKVTDENLVVFTVLEHTPWKRIATYQVPNLPACPAGGCICAWGWVPNGCGQPNIYMEALRCQVTGQTGNATVGSAVPAVWCEDDSTKCVSGPKQMIFWNQLQGNNVVVSGQDLSGESKSPGYNSKMGFASGAQTDIFQTSKSARRAYVPADRFSASGTTSRCGMSDMALWTLLVPIAVVALMG